MPNLTLDALLSIEREGWTSLCQSRGGTFYRELLAPDGVMLLVNGAALDRDTIAASLDDAPPWDSFEIRHPRVIALGEEAAALTYRARAVREGMEPFTAMMTSVYRLIEGAPRLVIYQQTTVTH